MRFLLLAAAACLIVACSPPPGTDCIQGKASGTFGLNLKWCVKINGAIDHPPKVLDGTVYVHTFTPSAYQFDAIDSETSKILWTYETDFSAGSAPFLWDLVGNYMIIGGDLNLRSIDRRTGELVWQKPIDVVQAITTDGKTVYVGSAGYVRAFDPGTGTVLWEYYGLPAHYTFRLFYDYNSNVVIAPADRLYVFDAKSGHLLYVNDIQFPTGAREALLYHGEMLYGANMIDQTSGTVIHRIPDGVDTSSPLTIRSDTLYYLNTSGGLGSYDLRSESQNWVYFARGAESTVRNFLSNLAILNEHGYIIADDDTLRSVSLTTGSEVGQWSGPSSSHSLAPRNVLVYIPAAGVTVADDKLYVSFGTNLLYAFEPR